tara:strand:- start:2774 stop:4477 length:1704 start_codon:yes stop_codon:yes gene_type:complete
MGKISKKKYPLWSIWYEDEGYDINGQRIMGRQAAGWSFLKGIVKDKPERISAYIKSDEQRKLFIEKVKSVISPDHQMEIDFINFSDPHKSEDYGGIFIPGPGISEFCSKRSYHGHDKYSVVGITHTTASHTVMNGFSSLAMSDVMPWDAIICTSECVLDTVKNVIDDRFKRLSAKFTIKNPVYPQLPVIPLGLDKDEFEYTEDFKLQSRNSLGINVDDIVIVYVGRLSFHAKAHHLPMYLALENCSKGLKDNQKIHIIQTGWFANDFVKNAFIDEGKKICPSVNFHFLDGKDQNNKHISLSSGDIFISLSDNIQETFGLTPIEGMAAGLAVLVSDWNGYKSTVRQNIDGYRVNTILLPSGYGEDLAYDHMMEKINYDHYVGISVQRVAIDISDCIEKLSILINDKEKRVKFGKSGKKRIKESFDWSIILKKYRELANDLDSIRLNESKNYKDFCLPSLPSNRMDPFNVFSSYPTVILKNNHKFIKTAGINEFSISELFNLNSINYSKEYLPQLEKFISIYNFFEDGKSLTIKSLINKTEIEESDIFKIVIWLIKFGYIAFNGEVDEK